ncbi:MAG: hypothetical protein PHC58_05020 [Candidatus Omnitrophica bacterium]|nr:hypothetical protein [Candidatus Omnitrophota bacterium]
MKKKANKKKKWNKPGLTRVALNSEQAVLSCCDSMLRVDVLTLARATAQCLRVTCAGTSAQWASS